MVVKAIADAFFSLCSVTIESSKAASCFVGYLLSLNYRVVSSVCNTLLCAYNTLSAGVITIGSILAHVGITLWDFCVEVVSCVCSILFFLWQFVHLVYRTVCLLFTAVEAAFLCLWSGGKLTVSAVTQSAVDVADACELTWNEGIAMVVAVGLGVQEALSWVGRTSVAIVTGAWQGLGYTFASILHFVAFVTSRLLRAAARLVDGLSLAAVSFTNDVFLGIFVVLAIYLLFSRLFRYLRSTPLILVPREHHNRPLRPAGFHHDDFESDVEYSEPEHQESDHDDDEDDDDISDEDSDIISDRDIMEDDDIDFSDEDDEDDVGTQIGEGNDVFEFSDSEGEEVQVDARLLPKQDAPYTLRSRSSTPAHVTNNFTQDDFEREIERERDRRKCVVCQDLAKSVLIMPCRHMCLCVNCAHRLIRERAPRRVCPLCRERIQGVIGVYV